MASNGESRLAWAVALRVRNDGRNLFGRVPHRPAALPTNIGEAWLRTRDLPHDSASIKRVDFEEFPLESLGRILGRTRHLWNYRDENLRPSTRNRSTAANSGKVRIDQGFVSFPYLVLLAALAVGSLSLLGLQLHFRKQVEVQLRLDRCVSARTSDLARTLNALELGNSWIQRTRLAAKASLALIAATPATAPMVFRIYETSRKATRILRLKQTADETAWRAIQVLWLAKRGCDGSSDVPVPLASVSGTRPPPDLFGEQEIPIDRDREFTVRLVHGNMSSVGGVRARESPKGSFLHEGSKDEGRWVPYWKPGAGIF